MNQHNFKSNTSWSMESSIRIMQLLEYCSGYSHRHALFSEHAEHILSFIYHQLKKEGTEVQYFSLKEGENKISDILDCGGSLWSLTGPNDIENILKIQKIFQKTKKTLPISIIEEKPKSEDIATLWLINQDYSDKKRSPSENKTKIKLVLDDTKSILIQEQEILFISNFDSDKYDLNGIKGHTNTYCFKTFIEIAQNNTLIQEHNEAELDQYEKHVKIYNIHNIIENKIDLKSCQTLELYTSDLKKLKNLENLIVEEFDNLKKNYEALANNNSFTHSLVYFNNAGGRKHNFNLPEELEQRKFLNLLKFDLLEHYSWLFKQHKPRRRLTEKLFFRENFGFGDYFIFDDKNKNSTYLNINLVSKQTIIPEHLFKTFDLPKMEYEKTIKYSLNSTTNKPSKIRF